MQRVRSREGILWRACEAGGMGLERLVRDLGSARCLNLSDRWVWEGKKSAGTGQAFSRLCEK